MKYKMNRESEMFRQAYRQIQEKENHPYTTYILRRSVTYLDLETRGLNCWPMCFGRDAFSCVRGAIGMRPAVHLIFVQRWRKTVITWKRILLDAGGL